MAILDRFLRDRYTADRFLRDRYAPDDPRVVVLADELARARGKTYPWLVWSGRLASDGDQAAAANALVRKRW